MPIDQTHTKTKELLEFQLNKQRETFSFKPSIFLGLHSNWMVGLTSLEVNNSVCIITEEIYNFELY